MPLVYKDGVHKSSKSPYPREEDSLRALQKAQLAGGVQVKELGDGTSQIINLCTRFMFYGTPLV